MRIGLYGGTFNPIHYGHIRPVCEARDALALDRVIYLPTANPPHKSVAAPRPDASRRGGVSALARFAMVELALLGEKDFEVSPFELGREVAYTVDTLEHFHRRHPDAGLVFILGSDSLARLDAWRRWRRILELAELAVLERPGAGSDPMTPELANALDEARVHRIANLPVAASSAEVRRRIAAQSSTGGAFPAPDDDLRRLVPPLVLDYIAKYELYR